MKISLQFPQFTNETALFVVTGSQAVEFHLGRNGEMVDAGTYTVPLPHYSDKEGLFTGRGGASGSVKEVDKAAHAREFLKVLQKELKNIVSRRRVAKVYLYAPEYFMRQVKALVKKVVGESYAMSFTGNYLKSHPKALLEMLEARVERKAATKKVVSTTKEAAKMLKLEK